MVRLTQFFFSGKVDGSRWKSTNANLKVVKLWPVPFSRIVEKVLGVREAELYTKWHLMILTWLGRGRRIGPEVYIGGLL